MINFSTDRFPCRENAFFTPYVLSLRRLCRWCTSCRLIICVVCIVCNLYLLYRLYRLYCLYRLCCLCCLYRFCRFCRFCRLYRLCGLHRCFCWFLYTKFSSKMVESNLTTALTAEFMPWESPPEVKTAMLLPENMFGFMSSLWMSHLPPLPT